MSEEKSNTEVRKPFITLSATRGGLLAGGALAGMVLYALADRGPAQFLRSAGLLSLPFLFAAVAGAAVAWVRGKRGRPTDLQVRQLAAVVTMVGVIGGAVYYSLFVAGVDLLRWLLGGSFRPGIVSAILVAALAGLAGLALFWFRLRMRLLYGVSEVAVGLSIAAWRGFNHAGVGVPSGPEFYLAILTASIYLVVRGLDNMQQGLQSDLSLSWLRRFLSGGGVTVTVHRLE